MASAALQVLLPKLVTTPGYLARSAARCWLADGKPRNYAARAAMRTWCASGKPRNYRAKALRRNWSAA
jgi:hypothetical protein